MYPKIINNITLISKNSFSSNNAHLRVVQRLRAVGGARKLAVPGRHPHERPQLFAAPVVRQYLPRLEPPVPNRTLPWILHPLRFRHLRHPDDCREEPNGKQGLHRGRSVLVH